MAKTKKNIKKKKSARKDVSSFNDNLLNGLEEFSLNSNDSFDRTGHNSCIKLYNQIKSSILRKDPKCEIKESLRNKKNDNNKILCKLCNTSFTLKKNLKRHIREKHLKTKLNKCPYCLKLYPRIKEHLLRCKHGIFAKLYLISEKNKIYSKDAPNHQKKDFPEISKIITTFSQTSITFINLNTGFEEKYDYTNKLIG